MCVLDLFFRTLAVNSVSDLKKQKQLNQFLSGYIVCSKSNSSSSGSGTHVMARSRDEDLIVKTNVLNGFSLIQFSPLTDWVVGGA